jgi:hypothetical protein
MGYATPLWVGYKLLWRGALAANRSLNVRRNHACALKESCRRSAREHPMAEIASVPRRFFVFSIVNRSEGQMACDHSGMHSGATRYSRQSGQLRLILVCDQCGAERGDLGHLDYRPHPRRAPEQAAALLARDRPAGATAPTAS